MKRYNLVPLKGWTGPSDFDNQIYECHPDPEGEWIKYEDIKLLDDSIKLMIIKASRDEAEMIAQRISNLHLPFMTLIGCDNIDVSTLTDQQLKDAGLRRIDNAKI